MPNYPVGDAAQNHATYTAATVGRHCHQRGLGGGLVDDGLRNILVDDVLAG